MQSIFFKIQTQRHTVGIYIYINFIFTYIYLKCFLYLLSFSQIYLLAICSLFFPVFQNAIWYHTYTRKGLLHYCKLLSAWEYVSVQFSRSVVSDSLQPHGLQPTRPPCPLPTPGVYSNLCPWSWWSNSTISSSVIPFSSHLQSFPASGSFQMSQLFAWGGQSIGVLASTAVLPMNIQDWSALGWTGWISLQSKGLSRVFSNTTVQKHQFFSAQLSL